MKRLSVILFVVAGFAGGVVVGGQMESAQAERPAEDCPAQLVRTKRSVRKAQVRAEQAQAQAEAAQANADARMQELRTLYERERRRTEMIQKVIGNRVEFLKDEPAPNE